MFHWLLRYFGKGKTKRVIISPSFFIFISYQNTFPLLATLLLFSTLPWQQTYYTTNITRPPLRPMSLFFWTNDYCLSAPDILVYIRCISVCGNINSSHLMPSFSVSGNLDNFPWVFVYYLIKHFLQRNAHSDIYWDWIFTSFRKSLK